ITEETDPDFDASAASDITTGDITKLANLSGSNTGDQDLSSLATKTALGDSTGLLRSEIPDVSGFITNAQETDPQFADHMVSGITATDTSSWATAHGWGDHAIEDYQSGADTSSWDATRHWVGQQAYISSYTETDPQIGGNTTNYLPRWDGSALVSGSLYDDGSIGIGTNTPGEKLEVDGNIKADTTYATAYSSHSPLLLQTDGTTRIYVDDVTGNVGIGTIDPSNKLDVNGLIRMRTGATDGSIPVSDANGVMTWTDPASILTATSNIIADNDNNTKIQVEENPDDDIIRFDMAGTEFFRMDNGRLEVMNTGGSVFIGEGAGASDDFSDNWNVAIGDVALFSNTIGRFNVANGYNALYTNTTGNGNVANGFKALYFNTTGFYNVANGFKALYYNTTGFHNVANGCWALNENNTGNYNVASGNLALNNNTTGSNNVANGHQALLANTTGSRNTAIGYQADVEYDNLTNATAIGAKATVSQDSSLVLGDAAKVGIGTSAPVAKLHVVGRTRIDGDRLEFVNTGASVFIGDGAGANDDFSDNQNVAVGDSALFSSTIGSGNVANGYQALYNNTGHRNVANGYQALYYNTTGNYNVANGTSALYSNT
ncbi:MAG: hypothetical protein GY732_11520, partial [Gammaproteobacteria bacterium]|nr:hypothetical protein [Gammaproteobacteria bacterium]